MLVLAASGVVAAQEGPLLSSLGKAHALRQKIDGSKDDDERSALGEEFDATIRSVAPAFIEVPFSVGKVPPAFTKVVLNKRHRGIDGIRFTAPRADVPWDLYWDFVMPSGKAGGTFEGWYIVARDGPMQGFREYVPAENVSIPGVDLPAENSHISQELKDGALKPGGESLIWFSFADENTEVPVYLRIWIVPKGAPNPMPPPKGDESHTFHFDGPVLGAAFLPDGRTAVLGVDKVVHIVDTAAGREVGKVDVGHGVWSLATVRPGRENLAATGNEDGKIRLWRADGGDPAATLAGHAGPVTVLIATPDGRRLLSGGSDRTIRLWDVAARKEVRRFEGHAGEVYALAFAPDGRRFVSGSNGKDGGVARVWDATTGKVSLRLEGHKGSVNGVAWSRDGRHILTGGEDDTLRLWDAKEGRELGQFKPTGGNVNSVAFLPDGRRAVSAGDDRTVYLWDIASGRLERVYRGHTGWIGLRCLAVSPDGRRLLTAGSDSAARVWDAAGTGDAATPAKKAR
ncbi:WD40 repeat domain-containing protein [Tundrisphaera sp. TA3]|uniref:WD40 repeat domain-containing protein n=1 Tax=Tundrisphaera sp. TA3 TaxID=3435775 RepID=UPI003EB9EA39